MYPPSCAPSKPLATAPICEGSLLPMAFTLARASNTTTAKNCITARYRLAQVGVENLLWIGCFKS